MNPYPTNLQSFTTSSSIQSTEHEKVELFFSCKNLKNMDYFSLTDPQVRLFTPLDGQDIFIGETEVISDNLNPKFSKSIIMNYIFEAKQPLHIQVVDLDGPNQRSLVGDVYTTLGAIVGSRNQSASFVIMNKQEACGELTVNAEKVGEAIWEALFEIQGEKLENQHGWFMTSSPYFKLSKEASLERENLVTYESEAVKGDLSPKWNSFEVSLQKLCNGDHKKPVTLQVFTRRIFREVLIGQCTFTVEELLEQNAHSFYLTRPGEIRGFGYITIKKFQVYEKLGFLDYLKAGVQLNMMVAVDFTASNGLPDSPASLHAINHNGQPNQYQKAMSSVGEILLCYDYDQIVSLYGFGGIISGSRYGQASHCFALSGDQSNPHAVGLHQVMEMYANALRMVQFSGPTYFAPVMKEAIKMARNNKENGSSEYLVLLILTDGIIHDMEQTIDCLMEASFLPLSVIIVGIGDADFKQMEILDGDQGLYNKNGVKVPRDLVQFVPFNEFKGNKELLASEVLQEIPTQLAVYMRDSNISLTWKNREETSMIEEIDNGVKGSELYKFAPPMSEVSNIGEC